MNSLLILLTHSFPFGAGEAFLDYEIEYENVFDRVIIIPMASEEKLRYDITNKNINVVKTGGKMTVFEIMKWCLVSIFSLHLWSEIFALIKCNKLSFSKFRSLIVVTAYGERMINVAYKVVKRKYVNTSEPISFVLYSYWLTGTAYAAIRLKDKLSVENIYIISRCHGHDLYEFRNKDQYLPYRKLFLTRLDKIYPISLNGSNYLKGKYNFAIDERIKLSYLGTKDYGLNSLPDDNKSFTIVSCSSVIAIKRVHLIIEVLSKFKGENVKWIHIGGGGLFQNIEILAEENLGKEVNYELIGSLTHEQVISFYRNTPVNLFINTSETEGIPVTIMEAISFGIPVIATEVGGVAEIVHNGYDGYLLNKDFNTEYLESLIRKIITMPKKEYLELRKRARKQWNDKFNAEYNYSTFYSDILKKVIQ